MSAPTIDSPELARLVHDAGARRVFLELTEHLEVEDYPRLRGELHALRQRGVRLAVDDIRQPRPHPQARPRHHQIGP